MRSCIILLAAVLCSCSSTIMPAASTSRPAVGFTQRVSPNATEHIIVEITNHFRDPAYPIDFADVTPFCVLVSPAKGTIEPDTTATIEITVDKQCQHAREDKYAFGRVLLESRKETHLLFGGFISLKQKEASEAEISLYGAHSLPVKIEPCTIPWDGLWYVLKQDRFHFTFSEGSCT